MAVWRALSSLLFLRSYNATDVQEEKQRFINDAYALALEITGNQTFNTVKPLLNIWAAFSPSGEVCLLSLSMPSTMNAFCRADLGRMES